MEWLLEKFYVGVTLGSLVIPGIIGYIFTRAAIKDEIESIEEWGLDGFPSIGVEGERKVIGYAVFSTLALHFFLGAAIALLFLDMDSVTLHCLDIPFGKGYVRGWLIGFVTTIILPLALVKIRRYVKIFPGRVRFKRW